MHAIKYTIAYLSEKKTVTGTGHYIIATTCINRLSRLIHIVVVTETKDTH